MSSKQNKVDILKAQIDKLYSNYGIDITDMNEEEYLRIINSYENDSKKLAKDVRESEKFKDQFSDEDII